MVTNNYLSHAATKSKVTTARAHTRRNVVSSRNLIPETERFLLDHFIIIAIVAKHTSG